ncbi:MAG TPA: radical SAM protein [Caldisericia bacterium]|nr:radical SAM protein [Caldisericia bacterium]
MKNLPNYLSYTLPELYEVQQKLTEELQHCCLCPRECKVNRSQGEVGFCKAGPVAKLGNYMVHTGEEPPISGTKGSGTVFFAHCTLQCCYCQNFPFSQEHTGKEYSTDELASIYLWLQEQGCHNLNWVSPTQFLPQAFEALVKAREKGLRIPVLWNSSGWENPFIFELSQYFCDIFLLDARYSQDETAKKYSKAIHYSTLNKRIIQIARNIHPYDQWDGDLLVKGLIVRILVLPGFSQESIDILHMLHETVGDEVLISLMSQYFPTWKAFDHPPLNRSLNPDEWNRVSDTLTALGFSNGWIQELS